MTDDRLRSGRGPTGEFASLSSSLEGDWVVVVVVVQSLLVEAVRRSLVGHSSRKVARNLKICDGGGGGGGVSPSSGPGFLGDRCGGPDCGRRSAGSVWEQLESPKLRARPNVGGVGSAEAVYY